jgi:hypothetical protein
MGEEPRVRPTRAALRETNKPPPLESVETDFNPYIEEFGAVPREGLTRQLSSERAEQFSDLRSSSCGSTSARSTVSWTNGREISAVVRKFSSFALRIHQENFRTKTTLES